mmetsp:Transcript_69364/g.103191  ORF Transcript_69364/g.103191 Transcript_69364/m.103191 type:complete len:244 (+) Transcript_69364:298-1029(+)
MCLSSNQIADNAAEAPQAPMCHKGVAAANDVRASRVSKDQNVDWSDDGAPFRSQTLHLHDFLWFPFLALVTMQSIRGLENKNIRTSIFWIVYESYIIFDHIPFFFTNTVYKSPKFNFTYLSSIFFWGFEAIASIVSTQSVVNAPNILLYNVVPHCFFVACNNFSGVAASKSFSSEKKKTWWVYVQVAIDNIIHSASLWYHLEYLLRQVLGTDTSTWATWAGLIVAMLILTYWVHKDEMSIQHF